MHNLKIKTKYQKLILSGMSLPIAMMFTLGGSGILYAFYNQLYSRNWNVNYKIAKYKAKLNANSGITHAMANYLYLRDFISVADSIENGLSIEDIYPERLDIKESIAPNPRKMGRYIVLPYKEYNSEVSKFNPKAWSEGQATVKNLYNNTIIVKDTVNIELTTASSLSDFLYLTNSERAGGAPFVFDGSPSFNNRREVNFGSGDSFNSLWPGSETVCDVDIKTNGQFVMSDFGCPTFNNTVSLMEDQDGNVNFPDLGFCNEQQVFQGDPPLDTLKATCLPPDGYDDMKRAVENSNDHIFLDATTKLNWQPTYFARDTLIMTDLEFFTENGGGVKVKQWWFLMPPYLNTTMEMPFVFGSALNSPGYTCTESNLYNCDKYTESMQQFHAKNVLSSGMDYSINPIVKGTYGFHHYDIPDIHAAGSVWTSQLNDNHLLPEYQNDGFVKYYCNGKPTAIYVKGGPVRVHGTYKGQYTVVTDEYTAYNRHAWGSNLSASSGGAKIDTLWNNIWITDDIRNEDASWNGSLLNAQPEEVSDLGCVGGSKNVLGLVSGANVYVANTQENGARNNTWGQDVHIHAHIIAFNESFSVQYWQNTMNTAGSMYSNPPYGDGQGIPRYGTGGTTDYRGTIYLWGGIVQKYRGYTVRNNPGPYATNDIGMDKNYNFDCNLKCNFPPLYPENIESSNCGDIQEEEKKYNVYRYF